MAKIRANMAIGGGGGGQFCLLDKDYTKDDVLIAYNKNLVPSHGHGGGATPPTFSAYSGNLKLYYAAGSSSSGDGECIIYFPLSADFSGNIKVSISSITLSGTSSQAVFSIGSASAIASGGADTEQVITTSGEYTVSFTQTQAVKYLYIDMYSYRARAIDVVIAPIYV